MSNEDQNNDRITRVIDFRIPLPWLLGVIAGLSWVLISMWFSLIQLTKTVEVLTKSFESSAAANLNISNEVLVLRFRVNNLEDEDKRQAERLAKMGSK